MKRMTIFLIFPLLIEFLFCTIISIPEDQSTIQGGINISVDGDTVLVQPRTYFENINFNGKAITVASLYLTTLDTTYISETIIDGSDPVNYHYGSCATFNSGEENDSELVGFSLINGSGYYFYYGGHALSWYGGGIYCAYSNPVLKNLRISNNVAMNGGGIYCNQSDPILENLIISNNSSFAFSANGGGIYCKNNSSPTFENVTIANNYSERWGAGISFGNSTANIENINIFNNHADEIGGGFHSYNSELDLENITITSNSSSNICGGIYCQSSVLNFSNDNRCSIYSNTISDSRGYGADIYLISCDYVDVILDTFTVMTPTDYYATPIDSLCFDILHSSENDLINSDLYVAVDGDNTNSGTTPEEPLKTIKYALSRIYSDSLNVNTIHLAAGVYSDSTNGEIFPIQWSSFVNLSGIEATNTILDAHGFRDVINFDRVNLALIENISITGANGSGIECYKSDISLNNLQITNNGLSEYVEGSGIYCSESNINIKNATISQNNSGSNPGGGIFCDSNSFLNLENVVISENNAYSAGGIYSGPNSFLFLKNVTVSYNLGGGIACGNGNFHNVIVTDNSSGCGISHGGNSPGYWENVLISNNGAAYRGGGISLHGEHYLKNVAVINNTAEYGGGGISCSWADVNLINTTIAQNTSADGSGGAIYCSSGSNITLINSVIWENFYYEVYFNPEYSTNSITVSYSDIQYGQNSILTNNNGTLNWLEGNLDDDPLFMNTGDHPYSLQDLSPCINMGIPDTTGLNLPEFDLAGNPRVYGGRIDMGAYENQNVVVNVNNEIIPLLTELKQNCPNPFNPETKISFSIPEYSKVDLSIYNIKSQKVKELVKNQLSAGQHSVIWDGKDNHNNPVSSGIYLYKLKTNNYEKTKKMILLR